MTSQAYPAKRKSASAGTTVKVLIIAASLGGMIGGWALLAVGQLADAVTAVRQSPAIVQPVNSSIQNGVTTNPSTAPRQVTVPNNQTQPRILGRTRSSR